MITPFDKLTSKLKGAESPKALAAYIGREKYGKKRFQKMAEKGKKEHQMQALKRVM